MPHFRNKNTFYSKPFSVVLPSHKPMHGNHILQTTRVLRSAGGGGLGRTNLAGIPLETVHTCPYVSPPSKKPAQPSPTPRTVQEETNRTKDSGVGKGSLSAAADQEMAYSTQSVEAHAKVEDTIQEPAERRQMNENRHADQDKSEKRRMKKELRRVFSRLVTLNARKPVSAEDIQGALQECGVRVDSTTANALARHVPAQRLGGIHTSQHIIAAGGAKVADDARTAHGEGAVAASAHGPDKHFVNTYEELRNRVQTQKKEIVQAFRELPVGYAKAEDFADILRRTQVSRDEDLIQAVAMLAGATEGGLLDSQGLHRALTHIINPPLHHGESYRNQVAAVYSQVAGGRLGSATAQEQDREGHSEANLGDRAAYRGFLGALWPTLKQQVPELETDLPPKMRVHRGRGSKSVDPSLFGGKAFTMPTVYEGKGLGATTLRSQSSMDVYAPFQPSHTHGGGNERNERMSTAASEASSAWSDLDADDAMHRVQMLKAKPRYGGQMRNIIEPGSQDTTSFLADKERWQTMERLAHAGVKSNEGLVDETMRHNNTEMHYFNRLYHVAGNREWVDSNAVMRDERADMRYRNRLLRIRQAQDEMTTKLNKDRDRRVFFGNCVHTVADFEQPDQQVKNVHLSEGTMMDHRREKTKIRLSNEQQSRASQELKDAQRARVREENASLQRSKESESKARQEEKQEISLMIKRAKQERIRMKEKQNHSGDQWSAAAALNADIADMTTLAKDDIRKEVRQKHIQEYEGVVNDRRVKLDKKLDRYGKRPSVVGYDSSGVAAILQMIQKQHASKEHKGA